MSFRWERRCCWPYCGRSGVGRGAPLAALLFFGGTLFPVLGFFNLYTFKYSFVANHYQYLAGLGIITLVAAGLAWVLDRWRLGDRPVGHAIGLVLLAILAGLSWRQSCRYSDMETLYRTTIAEDPDCWLAHNNLANALTTRGQFDDAIVHLRTALKIKPDYANAHHSLGNALVGRGQVDEAVAEYQTALKINPDYADAHNNLGAVLSNRGDLAGATVHFQAALRINPDHTDAHNNLGMALAARGQRDEAIAQYQTALKIDPNFADAHNNLGAALSDRGDLDDAVVHFQTALRINPDYAAAHHNLGMLLAGCGRLDEAISHFRRALEIKPDYADACLGLGNALAGRGQFDEAVAHFQKALQINPGFTNASHNLRIVESQREQIRKTLAEKRELLRSQPDNVALLNDVAWMLATNPNASIRNGTDAVSFAERGRNLPGGKNRPFSAPWPPPMLKPAGLPGPYKRRARVWNWPPDNPTRHWQNRSGPGFRSTKRELPTGKCRRPLLPVQPRARGHYVIRLPRRRRRVAASLGSSYTRGRRAVCRAGFAGRCGRGEEAIPRMARSRYWLLLLIVFALLLYRVLALSFQHAFDTDEFEHVQAAWLISQGFSIYRDFFEHHPPLLHFLLSPLLAFFHETGMLFAARAMMLPFAAGIMAMVYLLASRIRGKLGGAMACALLSTVVVFQHKSIEIRPDVPGLFFLLAALFAGFAAEAGLRRSVAAGALYAIALLFTPKLIFAAPAFPLMMIDPRHERRWRWSIGAWMVAGFFLPLGLLAAFLSWHDSLRQAIFFNVNFNLAVPFTSRAAILRGILGQSLIDNWFFWFLGLVAIVASLAGAIRKAKVRDTRWRNELVIAAAALGLAIGYFTIPVPFQQHLMSAAAVLSILAGICGAKIARGPRKLRRSKASSFVTMLLLTAVMLHPTPALLHDRLKSNQRQLLDLRYVWATVPADQSMFDCWTGFAIFRRPVFFYQFLGPDILAP